MTFRCVVPLDGAASAGHRAADQSVAGRPFLSVAVDAYNDMLADASDAINAWLNPVSSTAG